MMSDHNTDYSWLDAAIDEFEHPSKVELGSESRAKLRVAIQQKIEAEYGPESFIALVCSKENCNRATVIKRDPSIDPPAATAVHIPCPEHYEEGAIADYTDEYGKDVIDDPQTYKDMARFRLYTEAELEQRCGKARIDEVDLWRQGFIEAAQTVANSAVKNFAMSMISICDERKQEIIGEKGHQNGF